MDEKLNLYMIAPKGYEQFTTIVVAPDEHIAQKNYSKYDNIKALVGAGATLMCVDVTNSLTYQGYNISVSKAGIYH